MKTSLKILMASLLIGLLLNSCEKLETTPDQKEYTLDAEKIAHSINHAMENTDTRLDLINLLKANKFGNTLEHVVSELSAKHPGKGFSELQAYVDNTKLGLKSAESHGKTEIPELWMHQPSGDINPREVLVSFVPEGEENEWDVIKAYNWKGELVLLDPHLAPEVPVIVVELNGMASLKERVKLMNAELKRVGLQTRNSAIKAKLKSTGGLETTKLNSIRLNNDKEPWIKGAAEIYAITYSDDTLPVIPMIPCQFIFRFLRLNYSFF